MIKRLSIWFAETCFEILLLALALLAMFGYDKGAFANGLGFYVSALALLSFTTGYLFTTVVARVAWRSQKLWSYSLVATILFIVHSEIFFVVSGGSTRYQKLSMQFAGCGIVFASTFVGSVVLRRWVLPDSKSTGVPSTG